MFCGMICLNIPKDRDSKEFLEIYKEDDLMMIAGIEKHPTLQELLNEIEENINREKVNYVKLNLRKSAEYIVGQYIREYPDFAKGNLYEKITKLENVIGEGEAHLLHSMRKMGNEGGAHLEEVEDNYEERNKIDDFQKAVRMYNELLDYLPYFFNKFPEENKKPVPKVDEVKVKFELNIDYSNITLLKLHKEWWKRLGYNYMVELFDQEILAFNTYQDITQSYETHEIYRWSWIPKLMKQMNVIYTSAGEEYLDVPKLVKYYEKVVKDFVEKDGEFANHYTDGCDGSRVYYNASFCHYNYDVDIEETPLYIPAMIQQYFPGSSIYYETGKGYKWLERDEERIQKEYNVLVNGYVAECESFLRKEATEEARFRGPRYKRYFYKKPEPPKVQPPKVQPPKQQPPKPQPPKPQSPKLTEEEMREIENKRIKEEEQRKQRDAAIQRIFDDLAKGIF